MQRHEVEAAAARELLACYEWLAARRAHLLAGLLGGRRPVQWRHYPANDAIDHDTGSQYFYHCHAPGKRRGGAEHGHFHLFQRRGNAQPPAHLLAIALTAKGIPHSLFTVNHRVAGSPLPSAPVALRAIHRFEVRSAGDPLINRWMSALLRLFRPEIAELFAALPKTRDAEVLSSIPIDVDTRLRRLESRTG